MCIEGGFFQIQSHIATAVGLSIDGRSGKQLIKT